MGLTGEQALGAARKYVAETMKGAGAIKGDTGKSAYQSALDSGFVGTEAEWIASIKGETGDKGEKGDKGDKGDKGEPGKDAYPDIITTRENHIEGSYDSCLGKFALYGKAKQNTTQGNQLLPFKKTFDVTDVSVRFKTNEDGTLSIVGTASSNGGIFIAGNAYYGENVAFSLKAGTYCLSGLPSGLLFFMYRAHTETASSMDVKNGVKFTLEEDTDFVSISLRYVGGTVFNENSVKIMMNKGDSPLPWEPYTNGASPNPQYPQPIEVSGESGSVEVKSCGKNLLKYPYLNDTKTINDVTFTVNSDGSVTVNGTATETAFFNLQKEDYGETSVIVGKNERTANGYTFSNGGVGTSQDYFSYNADSKVTYLRIGKGNTVENVTFYPMIRLATDTDGTFEPYKETLSTIPTENGLAGIKVSEGGNYTDSNGQQWICDEVVKYADGSGKKVKRIEHLKVTSIQSGHKNNKGDTAIGYVAFDAKPTSNAIAGNVLCNRCVNVSSNEQFGKSLNGIAILSSGRVDLSIIGCTTVTELRNYVSENDVYILYELATPIETPLTAEEIAEIEKLHTFYPITNISNDFDCGMKVEYATTQTGAYVLKALQDNAIDKREREEIKTRLDELAVALLATGSEE